MVDSKSVEKIKTLDPKLRSEALEILEVVDKSLTGAYTVRYAFTYRSIEEQNAIYAQGRTKPGKIVTNAPGGKSFHNFGLAIDVVLLARDGSKVSYDQNMDSDHDGIKDWQEIVKVFKSKGWEWGGDWKGAWDSAHFQKTGGMTLAQVREKSLKLKSPYVL